MVNHPNRSKNLLPTQIAALRNLHGAWLDGDPWVTSSHTGFDGEYSRGSRSQINTYQSLVRRGFARQRPSGYRPGRTIRDAAAWCITEDGQTALMLVTRGEG